MPNAQVFNMPVEERLELMAIIGSNGVDAEREFFDNIISKLNLARYSDNLESRTALHRFFERLIPYLDRPPNVSTYREMDWDNYRFIIHELFLYAIASLIRYDRFESAAYLMSNDYFVPGRSEYGRDVMIPFDVFRQHMKSLIHRNTRTGFITS
jgi:hypothetical protein